MSGITRDQIMLDIVAEYKTGKRDFRSADLCGANLCGANLCGANLCGADLRSANLCGANLCGANLRGANLRSADLYGANLRSANLYGANLRSANLCGANLRSANLRNANLRNANLRSANLRSANLGLQWIIQGQTRSDGYCFQLQHLTGESEPIVLAGCRYFPLEQAREHWHTTRGGTPLGDETLAIIDCMEKIMHIRGLK